MTHSNICSAHPAIVFLILDSEAHESRCQIVFLQLGSTLDFYHASENEWNRKVGTALLSAENEYLG